MITSLPFFIYFSIISLQFARCAGFEHQHSLRLGKDKGMPQVAFSSHWHTLGPFKIGTREAIWGADPLEVQGGFSNLVYKSEDTFPSPLVANASAYWTDNEFVTHDHNNVATVSINLQYDAIDWAFLQSIYGWSALQYQAWTRGVIWNNAETTLRVAIHATSILEFWLNDVHIFGGDFYGFKRAPFIAHLTPGKNVMNVRLIREVRAMGGKSPPIIDAEISVEVVVNDLQLVPGTFVIPDVVQDHFASSHASIVLCNQGETEIAILNLSPVEDSSNNLVVLQQIEIFPGQSKPIHFSLSSIAPQKSELALRIQYQRKDSDEVFDIDVSLPFVQRAIHKPHKITFLHPSGVVSYAILKPPPSLAHNTHDDNLPILLLLHGAGLEADSHQVRHSLDDAPDLAAWVLFPTGMSPWSGDDWHNWGDADAMAAIHAIPEWIRTHNWRGKGVTLHRYIVSGHSNGGQGTWYIATHQPDRVVAAAPASGYSSIENYVPYVMWNEADPSQDAILSLSRSSFRHELFLDNLQQTPIVVQHGGDDDNVPTYHSRLMTTLSSYVDGLLQYFELPHKGHWFDGAITTTPMLDFYQKSIRMSSQIIHIPNKFTFVCGNSDAFGSRYGIWIDQLRTPGRLGRVDVETEEGATAINWHIKTANIHRMHFDFSQPGGPVPKVIKIDQDPSLVFVDETIREISFVRENDGLWSRVAQATLYNIGERYGKQRGALDSIMRSDGSFQLAYGSNEVLDLAVQISRNLLQYFGADSEILDMTHYAEAKTRGGNIILLILGNAMPDSMLTSFPIYTDSNRLFIRSEGREVQALRFDTGMGGSWLRPLDKGNLELVLWGYDKAGLSQAVRMAPTLTGAGQPDFVIFGNSCRWKGHGGTLAMGFFDHGWNVSKESYLP